MEGFFCVLKWKGGDAGEAEVPSKGLFGGPMKANRCTSILKLKIERRNGR
jgi:hypothetical protein